MAGLPRWLFATTAAAGAAALGALAIVTFQAIRTGSWPVAGLTAALGAYLVWWSLRYLRRNRPRSFTPDAIPADVLPPAASAN
jgi:ABC-type cobalamin transport system permease subunit